MEPFPDLATLTDEELKKLLEELIADEERVSYERRILHGKIDILKAERDVRLKKSKGESVLEHVDVDRLAEILSGKSTPPNPSD